MPLITALREEDGFEVLTERLFSSIGAASEKLMRHSKTVEILKSISRLW